MTCTRIWLYKNVKHLFKIDSTSFDYYPMIFNTTYITDFFEKCDFAQRLIRCINYSQTFMIEKVVLDVSYNFLRLKYLFVLIIIPIFCIINLISGYITLAVSKKVKLEIKKKKEKSKKFLGIFKS